MKFSGNYVPGGSVIEFILPRENNFHYAPSEKWSRDII